MQKSDNNQKQSLTRFESMLKTNNVYFFDAKEFEGIIHYYIDFGKHSLAKKAVKLGLEQHPTSTHLQLLRSELFIFENKFKDAEKILDRILSIEPNNEEIYIQKATIFSKNKQHKKAIEQLKIALLYVEEETDILAMLGMEYLFLENFDEARLNFAKCLEVDYEDYSCLYNIIYCYDMEDKHEEAITYLNKYINADPYSEVAWHQLGRQYFILKNYNEAVRAFDYAILIDEYFVGAYLEKAKSLEYLGDFEKAIENYLITIEIDDPTAFAYLRLGTCHEKLLNNDLAIQYYLKTVEEDPLLDNGWISLATVYAKQKDYHKALYYINKALEIDDSNTIYWRKYAEVNLKLSLFEETAQAFRNCIDLEDTALEIWVSLADVLYYIGDFKDALETLERAQFEHGGFCEITYRLFGINAVLHKSKKAEKYLKKSLQIDFEYYKVMEEIFPTVFKEDRVRKIIQNFGKYL